LRVWFGQLKRLGQARRDRGSKNAMNIQKKWINYNSIPNCVSFKYVKEIMKNEMDM
jgi:glycogen synthase